MPRGQVRPRGRPRSTGFKHPNNQQNLAGDKSKKFEEEYDLEQESQKFEEIRHKLGKVIINVTHYVYSTGCPQLIRSSLWNLNICIQKFTFIDF